MHVLNYFGELNARAARQAISEGLGGADLAAPLSMRGNSAANDDQEYPRPVELADVQARLFSSM
jgi:hypothetical protein